VADVIETADLRGYLKLLSEMGRGRRRQDGYAHASIEEFVAVHGESFTPSPRPAWVEKGPPKFCFANAKELVERRSGLTYVEGYALAAGAIPALHAWTVDEGGRVIDPTWDWGGAYHPIDADSMIGVRFPLGVVQARWASGDGVSVLDCWELEWPLLRHGWDPLDPQATISAFVAAEFARRARRRRG
jgi:hypothetical protein